MSIHIPEIACIKIHLNIHQILYIKINVQINAFRKPTVKSQAQRNNFPKTQISPTMCIRSEAVIPPLVVSREDVDEQHVTRPSENTS